MNSGLTRNQQRKKRNKTAPNIVLAKWRATKNILSFLSFHKIFAQKKVQSNKTLQLTAREREIIQLIAKGLTTRQIAQKTGLSTETVKTHRKNALRRNSISSIPQLVFLMNQ